MNSAEGAKVEEGKIERLHITCFPIIAALGIESGRSRNDTNYEHHQ